MGDDIRLFDDINVLIEENNAFLNTAPKSVYQQLLANLKAECPKKINEILMILEKSKHAGNHYTLTVALCTSC